MTETAPPRTGDAVVSLADEALDFITQRLIETRKGVTATEVQGEAVAVLLVAAAKGQVEFNKEGGVAMLNLGRQFFLAHAGQAFDGRTTAAINCALAKK